MNPPTRPNPAPVTSSTSQIGTIVIGAVAGLTVCAVLTTIILKMQTVPSTQVTS